ncbi:MAG: DUF2628 domain-containing protein [Xanthobacteraceae bacterium]|nr:MAG: DUF2628 domain-containing protein [Xanthobacteraceae bacterium]
MAVYTVHAPPASRDGGLPAPDRVVFVRDGFYVWAFVFGPLWLAFHRLWLALIGFAAATAALHGALVLAGRVGVIPYSVALAALLLGLEAGSLRRWTLARNGWQGLGVVIGDTIEEAEYRFFASWNGRRQEPPAAAPPSAPLSAPPRSGSSPDVIGLFPHPGAPR